MSDRPFCTHYIFSTTEIALLPGNRAAGIGYEEEQRRMQSSLSFVQRLVESVPYQITGDGQKQITHQQPEAMLEAQKRQVIYAAAAYMRRFYMSSNVSFKTHHETVVALAALYLAQQALNLDDMFLLPPGDFSSTQAHLIACQAVKMDFPGLLGLDEITSTIISRSTEMALALSYDLMPTENAVHVIPALFDVVRSLFLRRAVAAATSSEQEQKAHRLIESFSRDTLSMTETDPYFALNRKQTVNATPTLISEEASEARELDREGWVQLITERPTITPQLRPLADLLAKSVGCDTEILGQSLDSQEVRKWHVSPGEMDGQVMSLATDIALSAAINSDIILRHSAAEIAGAALVAAIANTVLMAIGYSQRSAIVSAGCALSFADALVEVFALSLPINHSVSFYEQPPVVREYITQAKHQAAQAVFEIIDWYGPSLFKPHQPKETARNERLEHDLVELASLQVARKTESSLNHLISPYLQYKLVCPRYRGTGEYKPRYLY